MCAKCACGGQRTIGFNTLLSSLFEESLVSASHLPQAAGITDCHATASGFYVGSGELYSGHQVCKQVLLPIEPSLQLRPLFFINYTDSVVPLQQQKMTSCKASHRGLKGMEKVVLETRCAPKHFLFCFLAHRGSVMADQMVSGCFHLGVCHTLQPDSFESPVSRCFCSSKTLSCSTRLPWAVSGCFSIPFLFIPLFFFFLEIIHLFLPNFSCLVFFSLLFIHVSILVYSESNNTGNKVFLMVPSPTTFLNCAKTHINQLFTTEHGLYLCFNWG